MKKMSTVVKILIIVLVVFTLLLSAGVAYILFAPNTMPKPFYVTLGGETAAGSGESTHVETPEPIESEIIPVVKPGDGIMISTGSKIINLADPSGRKYIKITVVLEFSYSSVEGGAADSNNEGEAVDPKLAYEEEITSKQAIIDDVVITLLSTKTFEELYTAEGKETLRNEIMFLTNQRLPQYRILGVYFTEFVVQ
jgi:flagellar FliL protein